MTSMAFEMPSTKNTTKNLNKAEGSFVYAEIMKLYLPAVLRVT